MEDKLPSLNHKQESIKEVIDFLNYLDSLIDSVEDTEDTIDIEIELDSDQKEDLEDAVFSDKTDTPQPEPEKEKGNNISFLKKVIEATTEVSSLPEVEEKLEDQIEEKKERLIDSEKPETESEEEVELTETKKEKEEEPVVEKEVESESSLIEEKEESSSEKGEVTEVKSFWKTFLKRTTLVLGLSVIVFFLIYFLKSKGLI